MKRAVRYARFVCLLTVLSLVTGCGSAVGTGAQAENTQTEDTQVLTEVADDIDTSSEEATVSGDGTDSAGDEENAEADENFVSEKELMDELFGVTDSVAANSGSDESTTDGEDAISAIPKAEDPFEDDPSVGALLNLLEGIYSAAPGTAGSSIRLEYAAKELLDFSETYSGNISTVYLTLNTNTWLDEKSEYGAVNIREDFAECLSMVNSMAESIAEDPSVPTPLAEDYDYTLQYDSYDTKKLEEIVYYIGLATEVPQQENGDEAN